MPSIGIPLGVPPGPPGAAAGVALALVPGNAEPTWLNAGAVEAQLCGTESMPSEAARPTPAVTWALPIPGTPKTLVPEPKPLPTANPNAEWLPKTPAVGPTDCMSEPAEPNAEMPKVDIDAAEPVPDARLVPDVSAVGNEARVAHDDAGDDDDEDAIDEVAEASPCARLGAVAVVSWVDSMELSWVDITELSWVDISELNWLDSRELNWVDIIELIWDSMELSGGYQQSSAGWQQRTRAVMPFELLCRSGLAGLGGRARLLRPILPRQWSAAA